MSDAPSSPTGSPLPEPRADTGPSPHPQRGAAPNYAARRMLVTTIAITAIVAAAVVAWRFVSSEESGTTGERGGWEQIALVDRSTGAIGRLDTEGQPIGNAVGLGRVVEVYTQGDNMALVGNDRVVLASPDAESVTIPIERNSTVSPMRTSERLHLAVGQPTGGNVLIIDAMTGDVLDIGALAQQTSPRLFIETLRWSSDASAFAVADAANFQTIVVRPGSTEAIFLPDQPVAIADDLVATSQVVGQQADVTLLDFERKNQGFVPTGIPAGGVLEDDRLLMVSVDGGVYRVDKGAQEADRIGEVAVPGGATVDSVRPIAGGERLVVSGQFFQAVVDLEGKTVFNTAFATPQVFAVPDVEWTCLPVAGDEVSHSLVDAITGEPLADLAGVTVLGTSSDGCAVLVDRNGVFELIDGERSIQLGSGRFAELGPDGRTIVRATTDGRTELLRIDDDFEIAETVDISAQASLNTSVAFLGS